MPAPRAGIDSSVRRLIACLFLFALFSLVSQVQAGEVDLTAADCPPFPDPAKRLGIWIVLHEDGSAEGCEIATGGSRNCADAYDEREGFLCVSFNGDKHPRSVNTTAEGPRSSAVDALVVDGALAEPVYGYANSRYVAEFGSGPSGETYSVVARTLWDRRNSEYASMFRTLETTQSASTHYRSNSTNDRIPERPLRALSYPSPQFASGSPWSVSSPFPTTSRRAPDGRQSDPVFVARPVDVRRAVRRRAASSRRTCRRAM